MKFKLLKIIMFFYLIKITYPFIIYIYLIYILLLLLCLSSLINKAYSYILKNSKKDNFIYFEIPKPSIKEDIVDLYNFYNYIIYYNAYNILYISVYIFNIYKSIYTDIYMNHIWIHELDKKNLIIILDNLFGIIKIILILILHIMILFLSVTLYINYNILKSIYLWFVFKNYKDYKGFIDFYIKKSNLILLYKKLLYTSYGFQINTKGKIISKIIKSPDSYSKAEDIIFKRVLSKVLKEEGLDNKVFEESFDKKENREDFENIKNMIINNIEVDSKPYINKKESIFIPKQDIVFEKKKIFKEFCQKNMQKSDVDIYNERESLVKSMKDSSDFMKKSENFQISMARSKGEKKNHPYAFHEDHSPLIKMNTVPLKEEDSMEFNIHKFGPNNKTQYGICRGDLSKLDYNTQYNIYTANYTSNVDNNSLIEKVDFIGNSSPYLVNKYNLESQPGVVAKINSEPGDLHLNQEDFLRSKDKKAEVYADFNADQIIDKYHEKSPVFLNSKNKDHINIVNGANDGIINDQKEVIDSLGIGKNADLYLNNYNPSFRIGQINNDLYKIFGRDFDRNEFNNELFEESLRLQDTLWNKDGLDYSSYIDAIENSISSLREKNGSEFLDLLAKLSTYTDII